jgi:hypothetical protein
MEVRLTFNPILGNGIDLVETAQTYLFQDLGSLFWAYLLTSYHVDPTRTALRAHSNGLHFNRYTAAMNRDVQIEGPINYRIADLP